MTDTTDQPASKTAAKKMVPPVTGSPRNDRPTTGEADGGSGTPDDASATGPTDKGLRGLDKSGGSRGGGR